jgi:hypothetical protein
MAGDVSVVEITELPKMDVGAPLPIVLADDYGLVLSYLLLGPMMGPIIGAYILFDGLRTHSLGSPNDEALRGHPLWSRGLRSYGAFQVENSPLIESLERINSIHPFHKPERYQVLKHFIFTFHDSTFECVATSFQIKTAEGEIRSARLALMEDMLNAKNH